MNRDTFQQALLATARVACAVALVGCGPKTGEPTPAAQPVNESAPAAVEPAAPDSLADCEQHLNDTFGETPTGEERREPASEHTVACCDAKAQDVDAQSEASGQNFSAVGEWAHRYDCCTALNWQGSMACTPWGPPTPPAMPMA